MGDDGGAISAVMSSLTSLVLVLQLIMNVSNSLSQNKNDNNQNNNNNNNNNLNEEVNVFENTQENTVMATGMSPGRTFNQMTRGERILYIYSKNLMNVLQEQVSLFLFEEPRTLTNSTFFGDIHKFIDKLVK